MKGVLCVFETKLVFDVTSPDAYQIEINITIGEQLLIDRLINKYGENLIITRETLLGNVAIREFDSNFDTAVKNHSFVNFFDCLSKEEKAVFKFNDRKSQQKYKSKIDKKLSKFLCKELNEFEEIIRAKKTLT